MSLKSLLPKDYLPYLDILPDFQSVLNGCIALAPLYTYGTACWSIYQKKTSAGFSIDICATMLMSSILRIFYYAVSPYEISLLRQAVVMVAVQCLLLRTSLRFRPAKETESEPFEPSYPEHAPAPESFQPVPVSSFAEPFQLSLVTISSGVSDYAVAGFWAFVRFFDVHHERPFHFWQWAEESYYWKFLQYFTLVAAALTALFRNSAKYAAFLGISGLFIEALLPLPQILMLNRLQSVENFKVILLVSWLGGDCMKLSYLIYGTDDVSAIFVAAALFQMSLDLVILGQYLTMSKKVERDIEMV